MSSAKIVQHAARSEHRRSDELLFLGQQCPLEGCYQVDFLPLKCQYCSVSHCSNHFLPLAHECSSLPPSHVLDRTTIPCPLCSLPISTFPGEDPNGPMERHIGSGKCGVAEDKKMEMRRRREGGEVCWRRGCGKVLIAKIRCQSCRHEFCPSHRHQNDHQCSANTLTANSSTSSLAPRPNPTNTNANTSSSLFDSFKSAFASGSSTSTSSSAPAPAPSSRKLPTTNSTSQLPEAGPRQAAALAAMKRFGQTVVNSNPGTSSSTPAGDNSKYGSGPSSSLNVSRTAQQQQQQQQAPRLNGSAQVAKITSRKSDHSGGGDDSGLSGGLKKMFSKIGPASAEEKHAKQESDALFLSLSNRHQKGLLSKSDEVRYAEMVAKREGARRRGTKGFPIEI